ncbi:hypothetical protein Plhal304r1_c034g0106741 [Plasmopara halstedii]
MFRMLINLFEMKRFRFTVIYLFARYVRISVWNGINDVPYLQTERPNLLISINERLPIPSFVAMASLLCDDKRVSASSHLGIEAC